MAQNNNLVTLISRYHEILNFTYDIISTDDNLKRWLVEEIYNPINVSAYFGVRVTENDNLIYRLCGDILDSTADCYSLFKHVYKFETGKTYDTINKKLYNISKLNDIIDLYLDFCEKINADISYVCFDIMKTWYKYDNNFQNFPVQLLKYINCRTVDYFLFRFTNNGVLYKYEKLFNFLVKYRPEFTKDERILAIII